MPRPSKGARLYQRKSGTYVIRDGERFVSTGTRDRGQADRALARHIAEKDRPAGPGTPHQMTVGEALRIYGAEHAPTVRSPGTIGYSIKALLPILGSVPLSGIAAEVCRRYAKTRGTSAGTTRRELGVLQAAINYCYAEGYLTAPVKVKLPPMPAPRDRWLERHEAAKLLRAAYRNPKARHLARFILLALGTGTRTDAILRLQFMPNTAGGWVDTSNGVLYRRAAGEAETKKRTPPVPIPPRLLAHLRRWERQGARYVVEVKGQRVASVKTAWRTALRDSGIEHCTRHDLRHSAVTWAMQHGAPMWQAAGFFGMSLDMLERTYGHHHPDYMQGVVAAMERRA